MRIVLKFNEDSSYQTFEKLFEKFIQLFFYKEMKIRYLILD